MLLKTRQHLLPAASPSWLAHTFWRLFLLQKSREKFKASALGSRYVLLVGEGQLTGPASLVTSVAGLTAMFPGESFVEGHQSRLKRRFPITDVK